MGGFEHCERCGRVLRGMRSILRHGRLPCAEDNVLARRKRAASERESGIPMRPMRRGRKAMMQS